MKQHSSKWNHQRENEVNINHLDVGGWRQTIAHLVIYQHFKQIFKRYDMTLTLINKVVRTNIAVRFTVTEASKKNGLKKFVE